MKKITVLLVILFLFTVSYAQHQGLFPPVEYIENQGQWAGDFLYKGNNPQADIYLKKNGFRILQCDSKNHEIAEKIHHGKLTGSHHLKFHSYDMIFLGCNPEVKLTQTKIQKHYFNYFLGNDTQKWKSNIHPAHNVDYLNLYENVDAHVYSDAGNVKYDLIVHPGGNVNDIQISYEGVSRIFLEQNKLIVETSLGSNTELAPYAYQFINNEKIKVECKYKLKKNNIVTFEFPNAYNENYTLYVDPVLVFARLTNSTADNWGFTATYDTLGNFYAGGICNAQGYPTTLGAYDEVFNGGGLSGGGFGCDVSISKYDPTGANLLYATYIGGTDNEQPHSLVVCKNGNLAIAGRAYSSDFPIASSPTTPFDATHNGGADIFIFVLNSSGNACMGATFIGGSGADGENITPAYTSLISLKHNYGDDARSEIIADDNNNLFVAASTSSTNFPLMLPNQSILGGQQDGVLFQLNNNCSNLIWSTYLGGSSDDACYVLTFDKSNQNTLYVAGGTSSSDFPTTQGTLHSTLQGGIDGFVLKFDVPNQALQLGTYIGTSAYDQVYGIQTNDSNHVFIMGQTLGNYPTTAGVYSNPGSSQFVTKLNPTLNTILASTVYGSGTTTFTNISPVAFLVDKCQNIYVSGWGGPTGGNPGNTNNMPITSGNALQSTTDGSDFYFIVFGSNLQNLLYATYYGQNNLAAGEHVDGGTSRFDPSGVIYQAICAACTGTSFPTTIPPSTSGSLNCNLGCLKIDFQLQNPSANASFVGDSIGCAPFLVAFNNNSTSATSYEWNFGDGSATTSQVNPTHVYTQAGTYSATLIAFNPNGCNASSDTTTLIIVVKNDSINANFTAIKVDSCGPYTANFINTSTYNNGAPPASTQFFWDFGDGTTFNGANPNPTPHVFPSMGNYTVTLIMTDTNACKSPDTMQVVLNFSSSNVASEFAMPDSVCVPAFVSFIDQSTNATTWSWTFGDGNSSTQSNPTHTFTSVGTYTVVLLSGNPNTCNKVDSSKHVIHVLPSPVADFTWSPNPPEPNTPNTFTNLSTGATKYLWDFGDGTTSNLKDEVHVFQKDGDYTVCLTAYNEYGCPDTVCKQVRGLVIPLVDVPTGFSPNGDGVNDVVYVKGYGIEKMTFRIFNRWGEKLFESTDKSIGWDGRYKGVIQEMEVYGYTLSVDFFDGTKAFKKGNITLLK